eukprot:856194-Pyramimonas_sp.AAC.1
MMGRMPPFKISTDPTPENRGCIAGDGPDVNSVCCKPKYSYVTKWILMYVYLLCHCTNAHAQLAQAAIYHTPCGPSCMGAKASLSWSPPTPTSPSEHIVSQGDSLEVMASAHSDSMGYVPTPIFSPFSHPRPDDWDNVTEQVVLQPRPSHDHIRLPLASGQGRRAPNTNHRLDHVCFPNANALETVAARDTNNGPTCLKIGNAVSVKHWPIRGPMLPEQYSLLYDVICHLHGLMKSLGIDTCYELESQCAIGPYNVLTYRHLRGPQ